MIQDPAPLHLDVFSDIACPWCYVGTRRLARALADLPPGSVKVQHHAFELQPDMPPGGLPAATFYARKFGGASRMQAIFDRMVGVGREDGITFAFDGMYAPNTRLGHRVVALASEQGHGDAALEALFRGHFEERVNVSELENVLDLLRRHAVPLDLEDLRQRLDRGEGLTEVLDDEAQAANLGIGGVPFFIADGRLAVSGAQPVETFRQFLSQARAG